MRVRLQDKGLWCPTNCVSCNFNHEDLDHIIFWSFCDASVANDKYL